MHRALANEPCASTTADGGKPESISSVSTALLARTLHHYPRTVLRKDTEEKPFVIEQLEEAVRVRRRVFGPVRVQLFVQGVEWLRVLPEEVDLKQGLRIWQIILL